MTEAPVALEFRRYTTEIGRSRIFLGRVVAIYVEDRIADPAGRCALRGRWLSPMGRTRAADR
jgi:flavin reductase (DIM6/NTAB) family NADH-FMN oxidoreductase RutF